MTLLQKLDYDFFNAHLFELAGTPVTIASLLVFVLILVLTFVVSRLAQRAVVRAMRRRRMQEPGTELLAKRLVHYVVVAVGIGIGLQTVGVNLAALFAASAILAVGLGFAMQNLAENFVAGIILMAERTIKPGDILLVENQVVRVEKMGIRSTIVRSRHDEELIVPNSTLVRSTVTNYTLRDSLFRLRATVGVTYGSDLAAVRQTLESVANGVPWRFAGKDPVVLLVEFGSSSVNYEVSVWIDDPWAARANASELHEAIWWALKKENIVIAFPQVDVHFDPPIVESARSWGRPVNA